MIRVLVVDDQIVIRRGLTVLLDDFPDIEVIGEASSGPAAVAAARALEPDVVLMDIRMPEGDGIAATRTISAADDPVPVIVITTFDLDEYVFGALEAGAVGFLLKNTEPDDFADAVRAAARGEGLVSPAVTRRVIAEFSRRRRPLVPSDAAATTLTARELDIVRALSQGHTNAQIADQLHLEPGTVKAHLSRVMSKLGAQSRVQLVIWAFRNGIAS